MQRVWENQRWRPTSCGIREEACGYGDEVRI